MKAAFLIRLSLFRNKTEGEKDALPRERLSANPRGTRPAVTAGILDFDSITGDPDRTQKLG